MLTDNSSMEEARGSALGRGIRLEVVTIAWMLVEACVAVGAGIIARSVLLTAFGVDSVVELLSGIVLFMRLRLELLRGDSYDIESLEARTTSISAVLLLLVWLVPETREAFEHRRDNGRDQGEGISNE